MNKAYVLFNPNACSDSGEHKAHELDNMQLGGKLIYKNMTEIADYAEFFESIDESDTVIIAGGDGTLNRFINDTAQLEIKNRLMYFAAGSGNDFLHDLELKEGCEPFDIEKYITKLPTVTVKGKEYKFINGIGYGIDGYCCEVGDKQRETSDKPVNYTSIAIKGLLFHYKPTNATVIVDGVTRAYKKVWLAPTMNGRFYGGGMMVTPKQDRLNNDTLSVCVMYGSGKLKTLMVFPSIFKGEHVNHGEMVEILTGREITVKFDKPTALQIDGETILGVTEYTARAAAKAVNNDTFQTRKVSPKSF
ncbi:MAG: diacylglycerol/lipid kinase family protein [Acutalibacteraceae bacterium]